METPQLISLGIAAVAALWIAISDFKSRNVRLIPLLLVFGAGLAFRSFSQDLQWGFDLAINAGMVTAILLVVMIGLRLTKSGGLINKQLGLGDVILIYAMATWFPPIGFMMYISTGLLLTLAVILLLILLNRYPAHLPVPLAGLLAAYALVFVPIYFLWIVDVLADNGQMTL
jgi:hypothetical protein